MVKQFFSHYFHYGFYFLLGWFSLLLYQIGLFTEIGKTLKENKAFFFILALIFIIIPLRNAAFSPLVYFDEYNYILSAQNIIENGTNSICTINSDGQCQNFNLAPHGLGMNAIYAIFYDYKFDIFYRKIALFNLFLYLLNAILVFIIAGRLFSHKTISRTASFLILVMPFNIIYATTAMPATISNTLFLISMYCFLRLTTFHKLRQGSKGILNNNYGMSLFYSLAILSTIRVEYCILLQAFLLMLLCSNELLFPEKDCSSEKTLSCSKKIILHILQYVIMSGTVAIIYCYANLYIQMKSRTIGGGEFGLGFLNGSYVLHYFMNISFWLLSLPFTIHLIRLMIAVFKENMLKEQISRVTFFGVFFVFLKLYSFYSFPNTYRFIVPITSIYVLMTSLEIHVLIKALFKNDRLIWDMTILCLLGLGIFFVNDAVKWKKQLVLGQKKNQQFITLIKDNNLDKITQRQRREQFYFFRAPYLGQVTRMNNYLDDFFLAVKMLKEGANLFYLEGPFESINESPFNKPEKFIIYKVGKLSGYSIYQIVLRTQEFTL